MKLQFLWRRRNEEDHKFFCNCSRDRRCGFSLCQHVGM